MPRLEGESSNSTTRMLLIVVGLLIVGVVALELLGVINLIAGVGDTTSIGTLAVAGLAPL